MPRMNDVTTCGAQFVKIEMFSFLDYTILVSIKYTHGPMVNVMLSKIPCQFDSDTAH